MVNLNLSLQVIVYRYVNIHRLILASRLDGEITRGRPITEWITQRMVGNEI